MIYKFVLSALIGYLLGSLNGSLIVGKFYGVDVRHHGSKNAGMTNTMRTLGKRAALIVLIGDLIKGVLAFLAGYFISGGKPDGHFGGMLAGTAAILGHIWPAFFGFKGGKGVLTTLAVVLMIDWPIALGLIGVFIIILMLAGFVSLGSVTAALLFPITAAVFGRSTETIVFAAIIAVLIIIRHRSNIQRLLKGTEPKFSLRKKPSLLNDESKTEPEA